MSRGHDEVARAVAAALGEDLDQRGDLTSQLLDPDLVAQALVVAREPGVLSGTDCVVTTYRLLDARVRVELRRRDGDRLEAGEVVCALHGPLASILTGERTALNFLAHLSGVATATRSVVDAVHRVSSTVQVLDTRKTLPGLRALEKAAVRAGGGTNHRSSLSEAVLLKDNHLAVLGIAEGVAAARQRWPGVRVQVECDSESQLLEALAAGADAVLLDNMSVDEVHGAVGVVRERAPGTFVEASGGITQETAPAYAGAGVDAISLGGLTQSARSLDLSLEVLGG